MSLKCLAILNEPHVEEIMRQNYWVGGVLYNLFAPVKAQSVERVARY